MPTEEPAPDHRPRAAHRLRVRRRRWELGAAGVCFVVVGMLVAGGLLGSSERPGQVTAVSYRGEGRAVTAGPVSFAHEVRPILVRSCLACHGFDPSTREADLRLDRFEHATSDRDGRGAAVVPGAPDESLLIHLVSHPDPEERMPAEGEPLSRSEIDTLRRWIEEGASYDLHWSLKPIRYEEPPPVGDREWSGPIDAFIRARLESADLRPAPPADRQTLLRRVTFDLTGLPPTPEEAAAFLDDESEDAYGRLVDRLLESPHFGERWARHWLDLMRYAETYAHEFDYPIRHAYQYRDYVIRALNADVPYDQFVVEHIAGDLVESPRRHPVEGFDESILGTGFWWLSQGTHGPVDVRQDEAERVDNQIDVLSKAFLATTVSCARCHDHKFDPILTREYYGLAGFIQSSRRQEAYLDPGGRIGEAVAGMQEADLALRHWMSGVGRSELAGQAELVAEFLAAAIETLYGEPKSGEEAPRDHAVTIASFDGDDFSPWMVEGDAFSERPTFASDDPLNGEGTAVGLGFANSHARGEEEGSVATDQRIGSLRSPPFTIDRDYLHLLIGGGRHPGKTGLRVLVGEDVVYETTGNNSLRLEPRVGDLSQHRGQAAVIEIFDRETGGWGNTRVDEIRLSDEASVSRPARRDARAVAAEREIDSERLQRWVRAVQSIDPESDGNPFSLLIKAAKGGTAPTPAVEQPEDVLFDLRPGDGHFGEWFISGWAFGDRASEVGDWRQPGRLWEVADRASADSGRVAETLVGTMRSPTFEIRKPYLGVLVRGRGTLRVIIDGFTMDEYNALLFERAKLEVSEGDWTWVVHDVRKYVGHRAHHEIIDDLADGSIQVARAVWLDDANPPALDRFGSELALRDGDTNVNRLAQAYEDAVLSLLDDHPTRLGAASLSWLLDSGLLEVVDERVAALRSDFAASAASCPSPMRAMAMEDGTAENEYVFIRGDHRLRGEIAPRLLPGMMLASEAMEIEEGSGRLQLAEAMLDERSPFLARVIVNRVWHHLFGRGIVETTDDFGLLGKMPTHPELLDHLAWRFRHEMGWSLKTLIREVAVSRAYRSASGAPDPAAATVDPLNHLLSTREVRRLDGEAIRDAILLASGGLNRTMFGPSVPIHLTPFMTGRGRPGGSGPLDGDGRRSIYIEVRRNFLSPMMSAFDAPNPHSTIGDRADSNVPAQSLILLNDPFVVEQAGRLAALLLERDETVDARLDRLYRRTLSRLPTPSESEASGAFLQEQARARSSEGPWEESPEAWADLCHVMFNLKEFSFIR